MSKKTASVAIVGRMNVGKSTLFNRLSTSVKSITLDYEGVTRDVIKDTIEWDNKQFELIDTGGFKVQAVKDVIEEKVRAQSLASIENADLVLFVIDGSVGTTAEDRNISQFLHRIAKNTIVVVNKADRKVTQELGHEAYELGHKNVIFISAQHGTSIGDLLDLITDLLPDTKAVGKTPEFKVMFLGRPNVGKSSLMNALLQEERSIVSDIPGTTREPVTETLTFYQQHIAITDTPGIRCKRAINENLEQLMVKSAFDALKTSHLIVLLIDVTEGKMVDQDLKLAFYAFTEQYKSLIIAINKTDIATPEQLATLEDSFNLYKHLVKKVPIVRMSAKTGKNVGRLMPLIQEVWERYNKDLSEVQINLLFAKALDRTPLMKSKKPLKVFRAYQMKHAPITIMLEVNDPSWLGPDHFAFFENLLRAKYDLSGVPVKFLTKKR